MVWLVAVGVGCSGPSSPLPGVDLTSGSATPGTEPWFDHEAGDAGTVRVAIVRDTLRLESVLPNDGWAWRPDLDDTDDDVAIDFHHASAGLMVDFEADIQNGVLLVEVETAGPAGDGSLEWPAGTAADVMISVSDPRVSLDGISANEGWMWTQSDQDDVSIAFVDRQGALVAFEARTDDGRLEVEVESRWRPILDDAPE